MTEENEKRVYAFYKATAPGHRESRAVPPSATRRIDLPQGMPFGGGHFEGIRRPQLIESIAEFVLKVAKN